MAMSTSTADGDVITGVVSALSSENTLNTLDVIVDVGGADTLKAELASHVKTRLAAHEYPREVEFVAELPLTTTGKIMRRELRRLDADKKPSTT